MQRLNYDDVSFEGDPGVEAVVAFARKQAVKLRMAVVQTSCFEQDAIDRRRVGVAWSDVGGEVALECGVLDERVAHERSKSVFLRESNGHERVLLSGETSKEKKILQ